MTKKSVAVKSKSALSKKCFVICPIGDEGGEVRKRSDQVFQYAIEPAALHCGYSATRADFLPTPGMITTHIIDHLLEDDLVIADLTNKNPNVFYELAIRHAEDKPVIQIKEYSEIIPFDITSMRTINLDFRYIDSLEQCKNELIGQIKAVEEDKAKKKSIYMLNPVSMTKLLKKGDSEQNRIISALLAETQELKRKLEAQKTEGGSWKYVDPGLSLRTPPQYTFHFDQPFTLSSPQYTLNPTNEKKVNETREKSEENS